jgi:hypothetical protein
MSNYELNCNRNRNRMRVSFEAYYDAQGNEVRSVTTVEPRWKDVIPDPVRIGILESACHKKVYKFDKPPVSGSSEQVPSVRPVVAEEPKNGKANESF